MKNIKRAAIVMTLIFSSGLMFGQSKAEMKQENVQKMEAEFDMLKTELELSDEQATQLEMLYKERNQKLKAERPPKDQMDNMNEDQKKQLKMHQMKMRKQLTDEMNVQVAEILDEEQLEKYKQFNEVKKLEAKERHQNRKMEGQHNDKPMKAGDMHQHEDGTEHKH